MKDVTLLPGFMLLLVLTGAAGRREAGLSGDDGGAHFRNLWMVHMKKALVRGSGGHVTRGGAAHQLLYCRVGIGFHLQILHNGTVGGIHRPTEYCWLKVSAVERGVVGIRGVKTGLFLCMSRRGLAYTQKEFSDECMLNETLEENHYTTYSSLSYPGIYLALNTRGQLKRGTSVNRHQPCTHFLPRRTS
ncbi:fibroblast growth factor 6-like [Pholidichthys leucotaenia]